MYLYANDANLADLTYEEVGYGVYDKQGREVGLLVGTADTRVYLHNTRGGNCHGAAATYRDFATVEEAKDWTTKEVAKRKAAASKLHGTNKPWKATAKVRDQAAVDLTKAITADYNAVLAAVKESARTGLRVTVTVTGKMHLAIGTAEMNHAGMRGRLVDLVEPAQGKSDEGHWIDGDLPTKKGLKPWKLLLVDATV